MRVNNHRKMSSRELTEVTEQPQPSDSEPQPSDSEPQPSDSEPQPSDSEPYTPSREPTEKPHSETSLQDPYANLPSDTHAERHPKLTRQGVRILTTKTLTDAQKATRALRVISDKEKNSLRYFRTQLDCYGERGEFHTGCAWAWYVGCGTSPGAVGLLKSERYIEICIQNHY